MIKKLLATALVFGSVGAQAALSNLTIWDTTLPGLAGVQFNTNVVVPAATAPAQFLSLGAHPYTSGVTMPNDGVSTFYGPAGFSTPTRANWSFDFAYNVGACSTCTVWLLIDNDPSTLTSYIARNLMLDVPADHVAADGTRMDSWNLEMGFLGVNFDPNANSITDFRLEIRDGQGRAFAATDITVSVPEPTSLALAGLALAGLGFARRRKA